MKHLQTCSSLFILMYKDQCPSLVMKYYSVSNQFIILSLNFNEHCYFARHSCFYFLTILCEMSNYNG